VLNIGSWKSSVFKRYHHILSYQFYIGKVESVLYTNRMPVTEHLKVRADEPCPSQSPELDNMFQASKSLKHKEH